MVRVNATAGMNPGEYFPVNVFACWNLGLVLGLDFLHQQDVLKEYRVDCLVGVGAGLLCLPSPLPATSGSHWCPVAHTGRLPTHSRGLCGGAISAWGGDVPPLPWYLERDAVDRCVSK